MSDPATHDPRTLPASARETPPRPAHEPGARGRSRRQRHLERRRRVERLEEGIARLSAHLEAATYRLLVMVREMDELGGWREPGFRSCAQWLSWRTGIGPGAARERVRVARALKDLPELSAAMRKGELSYSVARALTRVATSENEAALVETARHSTAAQMERLVRGWRAADRAEDVQAERERHARRELWVVEDGDGSWVVRGRLDPEAGAALRKALEAAGEALYRREAGEATGEGEPAGEARADRPSPESRRADAMGLVAEAALGEGLSAETADGDGSPAPVVGRAERYQVVVHVSAETLARAREGEAASGEASEGAANGGRPGGRGGAEPPRIAGGPHLPAETARRVACDAGLVGMLHGRRGEVLDVGRKRRAVPPALRRALDHRDRRCRFPGCGSRFCDAHHLTPWAEGGETKLENLVLLCRRHHRRVHEDGWRVERVEAAREANGPGRGPRGRVRLRFVRPDGRGLPAVPGPVPVPADPVRALQREQRGLGIDADTPTPRWTGERLDLDWALSTLGRTAPAEKRGGPVDRGAEDRGCGAEAATSRPGGAPSRGTECRP